MVSRLRLLAKRRGSNEPPVLESPDEVGTQQIIFFSSSTTPLIFQETLSTNLHDDRVILESNLIKCFTTKSGVL